VTAAGFSTEEAVAVVAAGAIRTCSSAAYFDGVRVGQRRRVAKSHSPDMTLIPHDPHRDASAFEPILSELTKIVPRLELTEPGTCTLVAGGPSRYYGSEAALAAALLDAVDLIPDLPGLVVGVGVADSRFAAELAAGSGLQSASRGEVFVPAGRTAEFLAEFPIGVLGLDDLTTLSRRLGIRFLGQFAQLPQRAVLTRFGTAAATAHQLARGLQPEPLAIYDATEPMMTSSELDPPAERVDIATFAARPLASELMELLARRGLACTQLRIEAQTEHGEVLSRLWRASTVFDAETIVERVRWQLAGWLDGSTTDRPSAGISVLRLYADEVAGSADLQISLWGEMSEADRRAVRGLDRVRGLLGPDGIVTATVRGGRGPSDRIRLVPWGEPVPATGSQLPWPGQIPTPSPSLIHPEPLAIEVEGQLGPVGVTIRGNISASPQRIRLPDGRWNQVKSWAGPWLTNEQWWDPQQHHACARFQLITEQSQAFLCLVRRNRWWIEATYD